MGDQDGLTTELWRALLVLQEQACVLAAYARATRDRALRVPGPSGSADDGAGGVPAPELRVPFWPEGMPEQRVFRFGTTAMVGRVGPRNSGGVQFEPPPVSGWADRGKIIGESRAVDERGGSDPANHRARATRRTLLLAAARRFSAAGYHGTSLVHILEETARIRGDAITKGALYFHFRSKRELALSLIEEMFSSWIDVVETIEGKQLDPLWELLAISDAAVATSVHDPVARAARRIRADHDLFACLLRSSEQAELDRIEALVRAGARQELLRPPVASAWTADLIRTILTGHRALTEDLQSDHLDLWGRMTRSWQAILPAIAVDSWLDVWRGTGWALRRTPDPVDYELARQVHDGS